MSLMEGVRDQLKHAHDLLNNNQLGSAAELAESYLSTCQQIGRTVALLERLAARGEEQTEEILSALKAAETDHAQAETEVLRALEGSGEKGDRARDKAMETQNRTSSLAYGAAHMHSHAEAFTRTTRDVAGAYGVDENGNYDELHPDWPDRVREADVARAGAMEAIAEYSAGTGFPIA
jgi:hypothetical protein